VINQRPPSNTLTTTSSSSAFRASPIAYSPSAAEEVPHHRTVAPPPTTGLLPPRPNPSIPEKITGVSPPSMPPNFQTLTSIMSSVATALINLSSTRRRRPHYCLAPLPAPSPVVCRCRPSISQLLLHLGCQTRHRDTARQRKRKLHGPAVPSWAI
jgi:hypothetical protein